MKNRKKVLIFTFLLLAFSLFVYSGLFNEVVGAGDFSQGATIKNWLQNGYFYSWNKNGSNNIIRLSSLFLFLPVLPLSFTSIGNLPAVQVFFVYLVFFSTFSGVSAFFLLRYIIQRKYEMRKGDEYILFAASIFYAFAPFAIEHSNHPGVVIGYYIAPAALLMFIKGINELKKSYIIISILLWSLASSDLHWPIFGGIIFLGYIIYDAIYSEKEIKKIGRKIVLHASYVFGIFLLLNSYWLLPNIFSSSGGADWSHNVTMHRVEHLFRNASMSNIITAKGGDHFETAYAEVPTFLSFTGDMNIHIFSVFLTGIGLLSFLLIKKKSKEHIFLGLLFILAIFLSAGPNLAPGLFESFLFDAPFSEYYRRALRSPKFRQIILLVLAPCIALSGVAIRRFLKTKNEAIGRLFPGFFLVLIVGCSILPNYPFLTGDFGGELTATEWPNDFRKGLEYLDSQDKSKKAIWGPPYAISSTTWLKEAFIRILDRNASPQPIQPAEDDVLNPLLFGFRFNYSPLLLQGKTTKLHAFLSPMSVQNILIHDDILPLKKDVERTLSLLNQQDKIETKQQNGFISIFEVEEPAEPIQITPLRIDMHGGITKHNSLTYIEGFDANKAGIVYRDQEGLYDAPSHSNVVITGNSAQSLAIMESQGTDIIPFGQCNDTSETCWSEVYSEKLLKRFDEENVPIGFPFDYGNEYVLSKEEQTLEMPVYVEERGDYLLFARYLQNREGGSMTMAIDESEVTVDTFDDQINEFTWKEIGEFELREGDHTVFLTNDTGLNAVNFLRLIPRSAFQEAENKMEEHLRQKTIVHILEAESDVHKSNQLGVEKREGASGEEIALLKKQESLSREITILKAGRYRLDIKGAGEFIGRIGDTEIHFSDFGPGTISSSSFELERGTHALEIHSISDETEIDVMWLYSAEQSETLEEVFTTIINHESSEILEYDEINPTFWRIKATSSEPFLLRFTESYNPLWEARIIKDGKKMETASPLALNGVVNGFWIDETGEIEIEMRYKSQRWFIIGICISVVTVLCCLLYIGYCRKEEKSQKT